MLSKNDQRLRRSKQTRTRIALQRVARLTVHRTNLHIYASVISDDGTRVLASARSRPPVLIAAKRPQRN
jgi:large subunit ribosomal protein L18